MALSDHRRGGQIDDRRPTADVGRLVWADEFDKEGRPDPRNWTYETGFVRNMELQWYQPENAWCEGGLLIIEARRERRKNPGYRPGTNEWRSGREYFRGTLAAGIRRGEVD